MANPQGSWIWYELMTPDPDGAKAFYDSVIGWTVSTDAMALPNGGTYRQIGRSDGGAAGGMLGMSQDMLDNGGKPAWIGYVYVEDVDAAAQGFVSAGGAIHMPPMDMPGVGRMAMLSDPWGAQLYVMKPTPPPGNPDAQSDVYSYAEAEHVRWNELWTSDLDAARTFYTGLFGWTQEGSMPMGPMGDYLFLQRDEHGGFGAMARAPGGEHGSPRWSYYIGVDDIDRAMAAVLDGGGTLLDEAQQIPGGEFSAHARDPQGADFGMVGPRKGAA